VGAHFHSKEETNTQLLFNGEKNQDKKLESKSSSNSSLSATRKLGAYHLKLMPRSYMTYNWAFLGLVGKIRRLSFQWDQSHVQLKSESTIITETSQVSKICSGVVTP
jgi:cytoskeletal protein RodZ